MSYKSALLNKVKVKTLITHSDDRGYLYEVLRCDDAQFVKFGQAYMNYTEPGVIKGFHKHFRNEDNFVCVSGRIRLVVLDEFTKEYKEFYLGPEHLICVNIPAGLHHGWQALGVERACVLNVSTEAYDKDDPDEERVPPDHFGYYSWGIKNR